MAIILASASPRRYGLLKLLYDDFKVMTVDIDETVFENEKAQDAVARLSVQKALAARESYSDCDVIITADTVVSVDDKIIGKPADRQQAIQYLSSLSGRTHQVFSGVTVMMGEKIITKIIRTDVVFRKLHIKEIETYVDSGESYDKAGGYGIQGAAAAFVEEIRGDYFNVVGLPVSTLCEMLRALGVQILGV